ncbi:hypothetical protein CBS101457_000270 [Exobasidium rhododendri]|nr:hypothetical protein CBS101457_000270 [Exobasidium rhododendri]
MVRDNLLNDPGQIGETVQASNRLEQHHHVLPSRHPGTFFTQSDPSSLSEAFDTYDTLHHHNHENQGPIYINLHHDPLAFANDACDQPLSRMLSHDTHQHDYARTAFGTPFEHHLIAPLPRVEADSSEMEELQSMSLYPRYSLPLSGHLDVDETYTRQDEQSCKSGDANKDAAQHQRSLCPPQHHGRLEAFPLLSSGHYYDKIKSSDVGQSTVDMDIDKDASPSSSTSRMTGKARQTHTNPFWKTVKGKESRLHILHILGEAAPIFSQAVIQRRASTFVTETIADQVLSGDPVEVHKALEALDLVKYGSSWMKKCTRKKKDELLCRLASALHMDRDYIRRRLREKWATKEQMDDIDATEDDEAIREKALSYWNLGGRTPRSEGGNKSV